VFPQPALLDDKSHTKLMAAIEQVEGMVPATPE